MAKMSGLSSPAVDSYGLQEKARKEGTRVRVKGTKVITATGDLIYPTYAALPDDTVLGSDWFAIPVSQIPELVQQYLDKLSTATTLEWCSCAWVVHPDDAELSPDVDECKRCRFPEAAHPTMYGADYRHPGTMELVEKTLQCKKYEQRQRRMRLSKEDPHCPKHTDAGRVMGFFQYLFPPVTEEEQSGCAGDGEYHCTCPQEEAATDIWGNILSPEEEAENFDIASEKSDDSTQGDQ